MHAWAGRRGQGSQPLSVAIRTASARETAPSLPMAADRWLRTVPSERETRAAITRGRRTPGRGREHVGLPLGQRRRADGQAGARQCRIDHPQAPVYAADAVDQPVGRCVLDQEPDGAGLHRPAQVSRATEGGQHDHPGAGSRGHDRGGGRQPVAPLPGRSPAARPSTPRPAAGRRPGSRRWPRRRPDRRRRGRTPAPASAAKACRIRAWSSTSRTEITRWPPRTPAGRLVVLSRRAGWPGSRSRRRAGLDVEPPAGGLQPLPEPVEARSATATAPACPRRRR